MAGNGWFACFSASLSPSGSTRLVRHETTPDPELVLTIIERRQEWRREKGRGGKMREKDGKNKEGGKKDCDDGENERRKERVCEERTRVEKERKRKGYQLSTICNPSVYSQAVNRPGIL